MPSRAAIAAWFEPGGPTQGRGVVLRRRGGECGHGLNDEYFAKLSFTPAQIHICIQLQSLRRSSLVLPHYRTRRIYVVGCIRQRVLQCLMRDLGVGMTVWSAHRKARALFERRNRRANQQPATSFETASRIHVSVVAYVHVETALTFVDAENARRGRNRPVRARSQGIRINEGTLRTNRSHPYRSQLLRARRAGASMMRTRTNLTCCRPHTTRRLPVTRAIPRRAVDGSATPDRSPPLRNRSSRRRATSRARTPSKGWSSRSFPRPLLRGGSAGHGHE